MNWNIFIVTQVIKEGALYIFRSSFSLKNKNLINQADAFKNEFTKLLSHAITLSEGVIPVGVLQSNEIVTQYTMDAERATQFVTGIFIDSSITSREKALLSDSNTKKISTLIEKVYMLIG